jgi:hypothetical protein
MGKTNSKLLADAGFVCNNVTIATTILRVQIKDMLYTST